MGLGLDENESDPLKLNKYTSKNWMLAHRSEWSDSGLVASKL